MPSIKEKLRALDKFSYADKGVARERTIESNVNRFGLFEIDNVDGCVLVREKRYPQHFLHGPIALSEFLAVSHKALCYINKIPLPQELHPQDFIFFDLETTGLAGGSGTFAFLCGFGYFEHEEFVVRQYVLSDYKNEAAYLSEIVELLKKYKGIISFNGKSYDIPLLKTRLIMNKMSFSMDDISHIDLLHPARRLWKTKIKTCTLAGIERHILGFARQNDVSGANVPGIFFNYLQTNDIALLIPVLKHNVIDILSMVSMINTMATVIQSAAHGHVPCDTDMHGLFQSFARYDDSHAISKIHQHIIKSGDQKARIQLALHYKRSHSYGKAIAIWEDFLFDTAFVNEAYLELAKYYEHKELNYSKALSIVQRAIKRLEIKTELNRNHEQVSHEDWHHRRRRLFVKIKKSISSENYSG